MIRVGVNGFGRIGRNVVRAALERNLEIEFVAVNDLTDAATLAYLLKYDSVHHTLAHDVGHTANSITVDGKPLRVFSSPDPAEIPWSDLGVEIVVESSGRFTAKEKAKRHLRDSVEHVIISAPSKDADVTICIGVNENDFDPAAHRIISNASCTTNCLAPVAKVLHEKFGIEMPSSLPCRCGMTRPIALAAPVEVGMMLAAADRARRRSECGASRICWSLVYAWVVVM